MRGRQVLALLLALPAWVGAQDAKPAERRPNIVFLLTDDQATDTLGCYGNPDVQTPQIDRLAAEGMAFDRHYVTTAICMASRASIITGKFEYRHGCNFSRGPLLDRHWQQSYPVLLRRAGYLTAMAGKIGFLVAKQAKGKGRLPATDFDAWGAGPGQTHYETARNPSIARYAADHPHATRAYGAFGRDFIARAAQAGKPFCLSISFKAPHRPATPDPAYADLYKDKVFRRPANYGREHGAHLSQQSRQGRQYKRFVSWGYRDRFDEVMAVYHRQIHAVDVAVGMIRKALAEHGVADNTVVVFTSDNGFFCGAHGYGSKVLPYEESARVPLIIYDPRHPNSGRKLRSRALTGAVDFAPTFLRLAGLEVPAATDGRDLMPLYADPGGQHHASLPLINVWGPRATHCLAVVTATAKYVWWPYAGGGMRPGAELFDLVEDPLEKRNFVADPQRKELLQRMEGFYDLQLRRWRAGAVDDHGYPAYGRWFARPKR